MHFKWVLPHPQHIIESFVFCVHDHDFHANGDNQVRYLIVS